MSIYKQKHNAKPNSDLYKENYDKIFNNDKRRKAENKRNSRSNDEGLSSSSKTL